MRYLATLFVLLFTLGLGGQALAEQNSTSQQNTMDSQSYQQQEEFSAFETDDLAWDDYGVYDEDFVWETNEYWYNDWYGDAGDYWDDYEYGYDDPGEAGWFDW